MMPIVDKGTSRHCFGKFLAGRSGRSPYWVKVKNPNSSAVKRGAGRGLGAMTVGRSLLLFGFVCLTVMVFTRVAEGLPLVSRYGVGLARQPPVTTSILSVLCLAVRF